MRLPPPARKHPCGVLHTTFFVSRVTDSKDLSLTITFWSNYNKPIQHLQVSLSAHFPFTESSGGHLSVVFQELLLSETETPVFPPYLSSSLPSLKELFAVQVKHVVSPNEVRGAPGSSVQIQRAVLVGTATGSPRLRLTDF